MTNASGTILECSNSTLMSSCRVVSCSWILFGLHQVKGLWQASERCVISSGVRLVHVEYSKEGVLELLDARS